MTKLRPSTVVGLRECGFATPNDVQMSLLSAICSSLDTLCQARGATGKTSAIGIILSEISDNDGVYMVVVPTLILKDELLKFLDRFLRFDSLKVFDSVRIPPGSHHSGIVLVGIPSDFDEANGLRKPDLIIMDEADELFGNEAIMRAFLHQYLTPDSKTLTLSATFPPYILSRIEEALMEADETRIDPPTRVHHCVSTSTCSSQNPVRSNIEYFFTMMNEEETIADVVKSILSSTPYNRVLIANCSIHEALYLKHQLFPIPVSVLDSDRADLDSISEKILIDPHGFLSRGVNIRNLDLGISLSVPESKETILHQWARVGRDNVVGSKFFMIVSDDIDQLRYLEFQLGVAFQEFNVSRQPIHPFQQHASTSERLDAIHRLLAQ